MFKPPIILSAILSSLLISPVFADASRDFQQPISIEADDQELDIQANRVIVRNNVIIRQGSLIITADRLEVVSVVMYLGSFNSVKPMTLKCAIRRDSIRCCSSPAGLNSLVNKPSATKSGCSSDGSNRSLVGAGPEKGRQKSNTKATPIAARIVQMRQFTRCFLCIRLAYLGPLTISQ